MTSLLNVLLAMGNPEQGKSDWTGMLPLLAIVVVFYFFMIRPQMKKQKEAKKFREALKTGDEVVTAGGIYGKISDVKDNYVYLDVDKGVRLKVDKSTIIQDVSQAIGQK